MIRGSLLNVGCGLNFHPDWINIDIYPRDRRVQKIDILKGLPYPESSIDLCYSSHVLEHLSRKDAIDFIFECKRVIKPGGILRLAVPDLERISRDYLTILKDVKGGASNKSKEYEWIMLELMDQVARTRSGGDMLDFLCSMDEDTKGMAIMRIGNEAMSSFSTSKPRSLKKKLYEKFKSNINNIRQHLAFIAVWLIAGNKSSKNFLLGEFRSSGEVHQWMYDEYSLGKLMLDAGFTGVKKFKAAESYCMNFKTYNLEVINGFELKPDSLYIEGIKS